MSFSEFPTKLPQLISIVKVSSLGISGSPTWNCLSWHLCSTPASLMMRISKGKRRSGQQSWRLWIVMLLMNQDFSKWNCIQGGWVTSSWKFWEIMNWEMIRFNQGHFWTVHLSVHARWEKLAVWNECFLISIRKLRFKATTPCHFFYFDNSQMSQAPCGGPYLAPNWSWIVAPQISCWNHR